MKKIIMSAIMACLLLVPISIANADTSLHIIVNGKTVEFTEDSGYPYIDENNRTMVPLRITMETAGCAVGYDQEKKTAIIISEYRRLEVPIGTDFLYVENEKKQNDTYSTVINGRTYLPIRAVLESSGFTVEWDNDTRTVNVYKYTVKYNKKELALKTGALIDLTLNGDYLNPDLNQAIYPKEKSSQYDTINFIIENDTSPSAVEYDLDGIVDYTPLEYDMSEFQTSSSDT